MSSNLIKQLQSLSQRNFNKLFLFINFFNNEIKSVALSKRRFSFYFFYMLVAFEKNKKYITVGCFSEEKKTDGLHPHEEKYDTCKASYVYLGCEGIFTHLHQLLP